MKFKIQPWLQIIIGLLLAIVVGVIINVTCVVQTDPRVVLNDTGQTLTDLFAYIGSLFLQALKMIIVPLIFTSVVVGIAGLGKTEGFARLGAKTLGYYVLTSFLAILVGLSLVNLFKPGLTDGQPNAEIKGYIDANTADFESEVSKKVGNQDTQSLSSVGDIFKRMIPENIFEVFGSNGQMLALITVSLLTGFGLIFVGEKSRRAVLPFFEGLNELTLLITNWVMVLAPVGVFGLVAPMVAELGLGMFSLLGKYFCVVLLALAIHMFVVLPTILVVLGRVKPWRHFYAMRNALLTAFSTSSSSATLPVTMRGVRENAGVSERVTSFTLPLGATVNMDGTALYECVAVMFIAQVLGYDLSFAIQFQVVALALLTSIGVAGVPSASLVAIIIIVNAVGFEDSAAVIGMLLGVDRLLDMSRTAVNIFSDSCAAVVIARSEGEQTNLVGDGNADGVGADEAAP